MYNSFIKFNGNVYTRSRNIFTKKECLVTRFKEKTDDSFYEYLDYLDSYARDLKDGDIYDLYEIDFCVFYKDDKMPSNDEDKGKDGRWWNVNETGSYRLPADLENDEVSISFCGQNYGIDEDSGNIPEGWEELQTEPGGFYMGGWFAKKVNIHDCVKFRVTYTYKVFEGEYLFRPNKKEEEVFMTAEEFKAEMLKHRLSNI